MKHAIEAIDAAHGYFIPVSDAYLRRKMRHAHPPVVLSPKLRVKMLQAMCSGNRMKVCDKEIGTIEARNGNNKQETYWGVALYSWEGENHLGRILMTIRDKEK